MFNQPLFCPRTSELHVTPKINNSCLHVQQSPDAPRIGHALSLQ